MLRMLWGEPIYGPLLWHLGPFAYCKHSLVCTINNPVTHLAIFISEMVSVIMRRAGLQVDSTRLISSVARVPHAGSSGWLSWPFPPQSFLPSPISAPSLGTPTTTPSLTQPRE